MLRIDPAAIAASAVAWNWHVSILDAELTDRGPFAAGPSFTLADIVLGLAVHRWRSAPIERRGLPAVAAYCERLSERAGFLAHGRNGAP